MATRWRGLLAPLNVTTGDGRRIAADGVRWRELPLPLAWQRVSADGHLTSVTVGSIDQLEVIDGAVWGEGDLFDDRDDLPRLAEDVSEARALALEGVVGPSVDPGAVQVIEVIAGTDEEVTIDHIIAAEEAGEPWPETEILFSQYEIAGATLVNTPAFSGVTFEIVDAGESAETPAAVPAEAAIVRELPPVELFQNPGLEQITALAREELPNGWTRVFGHLADPNSCHRGYQGICLTPPPSLTEYALFHRFPFETAEGLVALGRITTGLGQVGSGCEHPVCQGLDDHACTRVGFAQAVQHYDQLRTLAWVRVGVDERIPDAVWFSGIQAPGLGDDELAVLSRRRISGDWRDMGATQELCEILALAEEEPGFEVPRITAGYRDGRQVSLVAAGPRDGRRADPPAPIPDPATGTGPGSMAGPIPDRSVLTTTRARLARVRLEGATRGMLRKRS